MTLELRVVARYLGLLMFVISTLIAAVGVFALVEYLGASRGDRTEVVAMGMAACIGVVIGAILYLIGRKDAQLIGHREALLLVAMSWLIGAAVSALPYWLWAGMRSDATTTPHDFDGWINCYFEAMSGLSTTGATIVQAIGTLPRSILLWRAITHWIGGLGIVVLFVAVLPMLGVGSRRVYRIEAPGPSPDGVTPRMQDTARALWLIYVGLTVAECVALRLCGMSWFNSVCHTFATLATGGFSTLDSSIAGFDSTAVHLVIILFMVLAGINFGLYYQLMHRQWRSVVADRELQVYLALIIVATVIISISLIGSHTPSGASPGIAVRDSLFQVVAIQTTTGFCTADFDQWSFVPKATLLILMFVGGCAGSTGGGIKVARIIIAAKVMMAELEHVYRPKVVRTVRIGKSTIDPEVRLNTLVYLIGIAVLFAMGTFILMCVEAHQGIDITTAATASVATLNNIGPGLARVGATQNYAWFSDSGKIVLSILMVVGRLEMFTIVVLFTPRFWRGE